LELAEEIEHYQWIILAHYALGALYLDVFAFAEAQRHFEQGRMLAGEIHSLHWWRRMSGFLAKTYILQKQFARAEATLDAAIDDLSPALTIGQRACWCARIELALAQDDGPTALSAADRLLDSTLNFDQAKQNIAPRVLMLRGEVLLHLRRFSDAEATLLPLPQFLREHGASSLLWRAHLVLGSVYHAQKKYDEAADEFEAARFGITTLANNIPDAVLRDNFLTHANAMILRMPMRSPRRAAKKAFDGLTAREREVAGYIAQGKSNREIGDVLAVSERTVEAHTSNILNKLGFKSRSQVALWAAEKGLYRTDREP